MLGVSVDEYLGIARSTEIETHLSDKLDAAENLNRIYVKSIQKKVCARFARFAPRMAARGSCERRRNAYLAAYGERLESLNGITNYLPAILVD